MSLRARKRAALVLSLGLLLSNAGCALFEDEPRTLTICGYVLPYEELPFEIAYWPDGIERETSCSPGIPRGGDWRYPGPDADTYIDVYGPSPPLTRKRQLDAMTVVGDTAELYRVSRGVYAAAVQIPTPGERWPSLELEFWSSGIPLSEFRRFLRGLRSTQ